MALRVGASGRSSCYFPGSPLRFCSPTTRPRPCIRNWTPYSRFEFSRVRSGSQETERSDETSLSLGNVTDLVKNMGFDLRMVAELAVLGPYLIPPSSFAEGASYDPTQGSEFLTNLAGFGYVGLLSFFLFRVFSRRAKKFREEKLSGSPSPSETNTEDDQKSAPPQKTVTPIDSIIGAAQAGLIFYGLYIFTTKVDGALSGVDLPDQYTARNIAVTVRTVIRGVLYLATFLFGANCFGMLLLTGNLLIDPSVGEPDVIDDVVDDGKPQLPKISITSDPAEVRKAFEKVAEEAKKKDGGKK